MRNSILAKLERICRNKEKLESRARPKKKRIVYEKQAEETKLRYYLFKRELEKVSNSLVEPPGIFKGKGEHPHAGSLKSRIIPEMVTINTGLDEPIPKCPVPGHCWMAFIVNKEAERLATLKDGRTCYALRKHINLAVDSKIKCE